MTTATAAAVSTGGRPHFLLLTFPAQGHINPALQLAKLLIRHGATVTYATALSALHRMGEPPSFDGLSFAWFSDGFDEGLKSFEDQKIYMSELKRRGSDALSDVIKASLEHAGPPITCVVYSLLVPWAAEVARGFHIPTTLLWNEPATVLDIYYYYFNGSHRHAFETQTNNDPSSLINLPGLPPLASGDLPSFLQPEKIIPSALTTLRQHIEALEAETNPKVLVNTLSALEPNALTAIQKFRMIPVGPLVFSDGPSGRADLFRSSNDDYVKWLDLKPERSVIYISLGTHDSALPEKQKESLVRGVLDSRRPFLWVMRAKNSEEKNEVMDSLREEEQNGRGMIVEWCSQTEVLSHRAVGCFMTHCGWNSTLESLLSGEPMVAFPQFADQCTNAKLVEDLWRTGVRVREKEGGDVESEEIRRCLEIVMGGGDQAEEMRRNAAKWKELATIAEAEGGPADLNVKGFVEEIGRGDWEH